MAHGQDETLMTITHSRLPADTHDDYQRGWGSVAEHLIGRLAYA